MEHARHESQGEKNGPVREEEDTGRTEKANKNKT